MADPTFQVRGEPGHTHPEKRGGGGEAGSQKKSFWPFSPQFGLKIRRGPTPPGPLPWAPPLDPPLIIIIAIIILLLLIIIANN